MTVRTADAVHHARRAILVPGPYVHDVTRLLGFRIDATIWEMVSASFRRRGPDVDYPTWISFDAERDGDPMLYYGFPSTPWAHPDRITVAANYPVRIHHDIAGYTRVPDPATVAAIGRWVAAHMPGLEPTPQDPSTCACALVTAPPDHRTLRRELIVDFAPPHVPHREHIVVCATGWVAKIVPLLGRICADLALHGRTASDLTGLGLTPDVYAETPPP